MADLLRQLGIFKGGEFFFLKGESEHLGDRGRQISGEFEASLVYNLVCRPGLLHRETLSPKKLKKKEIL